jgi:2-polyprenyl-3-methyl-5-hydroxy-6-metoxy-1,4-benzoquinol methylase
MNSAQGKRILYIPVEFARWKMARSMPYDIQLALEEGFTANGATVVTLPAYWDHPSSSSTSWLSHARTLLAGQRFDQVWVIVVHCHFEDDFLDWLQEMAPVRVGFVHESLESTPDECELWAPFKYRRGFVEHQLRALTHAVTWDEFDAGRLNTTGIVQGLWWPGCVPARVITPPVNGNHLAPAVFCGSPYGERAQWLQREDLREIFKRVAGPEDATSLPQDFDRLQDDVFRILSSGQPVTPELLETYLHNLRQLRRESFDLWMKSLPQACAQINLPSFIKSYGSRVVEAMAAGCPAISWDVPNRPRNRSLFADGEEILLFRRNQPAELAEHIRHVQKDPEWAFQLATRAQAKVLAYHTLEKRIEQVFQWIENGTEPDFGEDTLSAVRCLQEDPQANPNTDETARWASISALLDKLVPIGTTDESSRILDLGCGRGWLTNLAAKYGKCDGLEEEAELVTQARRLFPQLHFTQGSIDTLLSSPYFQPYDFVLASEFLEYIPSTRQAGFARKLSQLLKPGGRVILTTPRGEALEEWARSWRGPFRPAESWQIESAVRELFEQENFTVDGQDRVLFNTATRQYICGQAGPEDKDLLAIYQVWAFRNPEPEATTVVRSAVKPEKILARFHQACVAAAEESLRALPSHPVLLTAQAQALMGMGQYEKARQQLVWLAALQPDYAPCRRLLAAVLKQLGHAQEAEAQTRRAADLESAPHASTRTISVVLPREQSSTFSFLKHVERAKGPDGSPVVLDARSVNFNQRAVPCLYLHPSTKMRFSVPVTESGRFTCAIGLQPEAWNKSKVVGCEFSVRSNGRELYRRELNPRRLPTESRWQEITIDVPAAEGPCHDFFIRLQPVGPSPDFRWVVWCDPVFHPHKGKEVIRND